MQELNFEVVNKFEMALSTASTDLRSMSHFSNHCIPLLKFNVFPLDASGLLVMPVLNMNRPTFSSLVSNTVQLVNRKCS